MKRLAKLKQLNAIEDDCLCTLGARGFFFSLGATELSGEAAKASRKAARKKLSRWRSSPRAGEREDLWHPGSCLWKVTLHSNDLLNPDQQNVVNELQKQQDSKMQSCPLDYPITETEVRTAVKKNWKIMNVRKIQNEMIKANLMKWCPFIINFLAIFVMWVRCL